MKHKKLIIIALCFMLTVTLLVTKPIKAKAEIDVRQSLIATLVISLINMGINVTTDVIEPYIVKWAINAQDYAEELLNQFDNVKDTLIVGFKTLTLAKRIQSDLLRQGLKNNGSITVTVNNGNKNYFTGSYDIGGGGGIITYTPNTAKIVYPSTTNSVNRYITATQSYDIIKLKENSQTYYFPTYTANFTSDAYDIYVEPIFIKDDNQLNEWLSYMNNPQFYFIQYNGWFNFPTLAAMRPNGKSYASIPLNQDNYTYNNTKNYKYLIIYRSISAKYAIGNGEYTETITWVKHMPTNSSVTNPGTSQDITVTAGTIDTANWSSINNNYTYEMVIESNNEVVKSNQALIDAVNNNTQSITQSQVIDTTTQTSVDDIKTNVWGISSILEGIKSTFQTLVKPITDIFNKTYTLEEINTLAWVNVMNELVTTIDTGVSNIIPYYQNYVGNYLQGISHPQANILTTTVNDILVNTNLSWAVYAISVILLVKGVIL